MRIRAITDKYLLGSAAEGIMADPELILPVMAKQLLPLPVLILFLGAGLSAVMSAAATALLALSGMISMNIYRDIINPESARSSRFLSAGYWLWFWELLQQLLPSTTPAQPK